MALPKFFKDNVDAARDVKKNHPSLFFVIAIILVLLIFWNVMMMADNVKVKALTKQIKALQKNVDQKNLGIEQLQEQIAPFKRIAADKFSAHGDEALGELAKELASPQKDLTVKVDDIKHYQFVAKLNMFGMDINPRTGFRSDTPITDILQGAIVEVNADQFAFRCDDKSMSQYYHVIRINPYFPFTYFGLTKCYGQLKDPRWKENALKTYQILSITSSFEGAHPSHKQMIKLVEKYIALIDK